MSITVHPWLAPFSGQIQQVCATLGLRSLPAHVHEIAAAFFLYQTTFWISPILSAYAFPVKFKTLTRKQALEWQLQCVSMLQSLLISYLALRVVLDAGIHPWTAEERIFGYAPAAGTVQAFAAGYFLWDLVMMLSHVQDLGIPMLLHAICCFTVYMLGFVSRAAE